MDDSDVDRSSDGDLSFDPHGELDEGDPEDVSCDQYIKGVHKTSDIEMLIDGGAPVKDKDPSSGEGGREVVMKKRKGRGPSKVSKVKETMHLEYDSLGQPCGKWRHAYGKQIGACVRKLSIIVKWKDVPEDLKSAFWDETVNLFHIEATEAKRNVFIAAVAERFRDFKSKLVSGFITLTRKRTKKEGDRITPPEIWPHVTKEEWGAFVAQKTTPQAIEKSKKASRSAKSRTYYHAMGTNPFKRKKAVSEKDGLYPTDLIVKPSSNATPEPNNDALTMELGSDHHGHIIAASTSKGPSSIKRLSEDREKLKTKLKNELKAEFHGALKATLQAHNEKLFSNFNSILQQLGFSEQLGVVDDQQKGFVPKDQSSHQRTPSTHVPTPSPRDLEKEIPCKLLLQDPKSVEECLIFVADGHARPLREAFRVHGVPLPQGHYAVCVDHFQESCKLYHIPVPISIVDIYTVEEALGTYVAWPFKWVQFGGDVSQNFVRKSKDLSKEHSKGISKGRGKEHANDKGTSIDKCNKELVKEKSFKVVRKSKDLFKKHSKGISKGKGKEQVNKKGTSMDKFIKEVVKEKSFTGSAPAPEPLMELVGKDVLYTLSEPCMWFHSCVMALPFNQTIKVDIEPSMLNHSKQSEVFVSKEDVAEFLCGEKLSVTIITAFIRLLNDELKEGGKDGLVGWLCPFTISGEQCWTSKANVREYILDSFKKCSERGCRIIIAPYLQSLHWTLIAVTPTNNMAYVFDSLAQQTPRFLYVKGLMNNVWREITGKSLQQPRNLEWVYLQCPQQDDGEASGHYIMRNMHYLVNLVACPLGLFSADEVINNRNTHPYTKKEIDEVRDKFATFISENFI